MNKITKLPLFARFLPSLVQIESSVNQKIQMTHSKHRQLKLTSSPVISNLKETLFDDQTAKQPPLDKEPSSEGGVWHGKDAHPGATTYGDRPEARFSHTSRENTTTCLSRLP